jgi:Autographiviridae endonuclease
MPNQYTPHQRPCVQCRTAFFCKPSSKQRYCSKSCWYAANSVTLVERLTKNVDKSGECWIWTASVNLHGYGQILYRGRPTRAHRVAYELAYGPIPADMWVLHRCDNRRCVRPDHLWLGTLQDNHADMVNKRRHTFGGRVGNAKLSDAAVVGIRALDLSRRGSLAAAARQYGVSAATIRRIVNRVSWRHC